MGRVINWEKILLEFLQKPPIFKWGVCDCTIWAADTRCRIRGEPKFADLWRGKYCNQFGATRTMLKLGWKSLEQAGRELMGEPIQFFHRGDLVLDEGAFGVCYGSKVGFLGEDGLVFKKPTNNAVIWRT